MSNYEADEAFCLRAVDFAESSQVVTLWTRGHGLLALIAKGARKIGKGHSAAVNGPVDLLARGQAVFLPPRRGAELGTLTAWNPLDHYPRLRADLHAFYAGQLICEFTLALLSPGDPHPDWHVQCAATLQRLGGPDGPRAIVAYLKAALAATGYQPHLSGCLGCGAAPQPGIVMRFIPITGGVWCTRCVAPVVHAREHRAPPVSLQVDGGIVAALQRLPAPAALPEPQEHRPQHTPGQLAPTPAATNALLAAAQLLMFHARFNTDRAFKTFSLTPLIFQHKYPRPPTAGPTHSWA